MKTPTLHLFLLLSFFVSSAQARSAEGPGIGGGGGTVVCMNPDQVTIKSVKLVDLVESSFYDKTVVSKGLENLPWEKQVEIVVNRISFVDPQFVDLLRDRLNRVKKQMDTAFDGTKGTDTVFPAPPDLSSGRLPPIPLGCQVMGAAIYNDSLPLEQRLNISEVLWKNLSETHKAGLFLHEAIYLTHRDIYRNLGITSLPNSSATRAFVGFIFSAELENSPVEAERVKFKTSEFYRPFELDGEQPSKLQSRLQTFARPLLPYVIKGIDRPLFVNEKTCKGKDFIVRVEKVSDKITCSLKAKAHLWPNKKELRELPLVDQNQKIKAFSYSPNRGKDVDEDVLLGCTANDFGRFNPGFKMYCDGELVTHVKSSSREITTGFSLKNKKSYEDTFLTDFHF